VKTFDRLLTTAAQLTRQIRQLQQEYLPRMPYFAELARLDKPIGIYLLLWPTLWGLWFAAEGWPGFHLLFVFVMGVVLMRSAGCVINDVADRNFDGQVKRTLNRPLVTQQVTVREALLFSASLTCVAFLLVLTTNALTIWLSIAAVAIASCYPFMKRYTYLPQVVLGVAFSWGIPMSFAAYSGEVPNLAWLVFTATVVWTVAYDTEYAMVDRDDDIKLGLKSTAILFGDLDRLMIGILQLIFIVTLWAANQLIPLGLWFHCGLAGAVVLLTYQQYLIRERKREECFTAFLNNHLVGLIIFAGLLLEFLLR
jgi:4-hydroxybenzoate polyprenyltransferase|tara:strand:- start:5955 stop:6884 length:930 start_codon:yes stop_codon:yes gene_type:complete